MCWLIISSVLLLTSSSSITLKYCFRTGTENQFIFFIFISNNQCSTRCVQPAVLRLHLSQDVYGCHQSKNANDSIIQQCQKIGHPCFHMFPHTDLGKCLGFQTFAWATEKSFPVFSWEFFCFAASSLHMTCLEHPASFFPKLSSARSWANVLTSGIAFHFSLPLGSPLVKSI